MKQSKARVWSVLRISSERISPKLHIGGAEVRRGGVHREASATMLEHYRLPPGRLFRSIPCICDIFPYARTWTLIFWPAKAVLGPYMAQFLTTVYLNFCLICNFCSNTCHGYIHARARYAVRENPMVNLSVILEGTVNSGTNKEAISSVFTTIFGRIVVYYTRKHRNRQVNRNSTYTSIIAHVNNLSDQSIPVLI